MKPSQDRLTIDLMAKRLTQAEAELAKVREELAAKKEECAKLSKKLQAAKPSPADQNAPEELRKLQDRLRQIDAAFRKHGFTIEEALSGAPKDLRPVIGELAPPKGGDKFSKPANKLKAGLTFGAIMKRIVALNEELRQDVGGKVWKKSLRSNIRRLVESDRIKMTFFRNGLKLHTFPFYEYAAREAQQILLDLNEGFYPSLLENLYPEGVFIDVTDSLEVDFDPKADASKAVDPLAKVPQLAIKDGNIVNPKLKIEKHLEDARKKNEAAQVALQKMDEALLANTFRFEEPLADDEVCHLKVRDEEGRFFYLDVGAKTPLSRVLDILEKEVGGKVVLSMAYPRHVLDRGAEGRLTMAELELHPQSLLLMKRAK